MLLASPGAAAVAPPAPYALGAWRPLRINHV